MAEEVELDVLLRHIAHIRSWAREVAVDGPWPAPAESNAGSNWKVSIYPTKRPSITPCVAVVDDIEAFREKVPVVRWP